LFGNPQVAIYTIDKQPFHHVPDGMPAFERLPQRLSLPKELVTAWTH